jgi:hypothetical protein
MGDFLPSSDNPLGGFGASLLGIGGDAPLIPGSAAEFRKIINVLTEESDRLAGIRAAEVASTLENLRQYGIPITKEIQQITNVQAKGDLRRIEALKDRLSQATEAPYSADIRRLLAQQIETELGAGAGLDPALLREVQQGVREGQTARGITFGSSPVAEEALFVGSMAEQLRRNRQNAAMEFLRTNRATTVDPLSAYASLTSRTPLQYTQPTGSNTQFIPGLLEMQSQRTAAQYNANALQQSQQQQLLGGLLGAGMMMLPGFGAAGAATGALAGGGAFSMIPGVGGYAF